MGPMSRDGRMTDVRHRTLKEVRGRRQYEYQKIIEMGHSNKRRRMDLLGVMVLAPVR